jgi:hypothetical protein
LFRRRLCLLYAIPAGAAVRRRPIVIPEAGIQGVSLQSWGHVRLPPSIDGSGFILEWAPGWAPWETELAPAPTAVLAALAETPTGALAFNDQERAEDILDDLYEVCPRFEADYDRQLAGELDRQTAFRWLTVLRSVGGRDAALAFCRANPAHDGGWEDAIIDAEQREYLPARCTTLGCAENDVCACFGAKTRTTWGGAVCNRPGDHLARRR